MLDVGRFASTRPARFGALPVQCSMDSPRAGGLGGGLAPTVALRLARLGALSGMGPVLGLGPEPCQRHPHPALTPPCRLCTRPVEAPGCAQGLRP